MTEYKSNSKKRILTAVFAFLILLSCSLAAISCTSESKRDNRTKTSIVCTAFPQYDWIKNIIGDSEDFKLTLLTDNGSDIHSYQPTVADRVEISECDLLVSVGVSDAWVEEMLNETDGVHVVRLSEIDGVTLREVSTDGIISEHVHHTHEGHGEHEHEHEHDHDHGTYDEHIWLSLRNAKVCTEYLSKILSELSPQNEDKLSKNTVAYISSLSALDAEYEKLCQSSAAPRLIVADRFPFSYMTADYGIEFCAAFDGCSTETNAGLDTVKRLAEKAAEWQISGIAITESSDGRLANTVLATSGTDGEIFVINSMQSITRAQIANGESYISIMQQNLTVLDALF